MKKGVSSFGMAIVFAMSLCACSAKGGERAKPIETDTQNI